MVMRAMEPLAGIGKERADAVEVLAADDVLVLRR